MTESMTRNLSGLLDAYRALGEAARAVERTHGVLRCGLSDETMALRSAIAVVDQTGRAVAAKFDDHERSQLFGYFGLVSKFGDKANRAALERLTERGYFRFDGTYGLEITTSGIEAAVALWATR